MKKRIFILGLMIWFISLPMWSAVPVGYYHDAYGKRKAELKTALFNICSRNHMLTFGTGKGSTWDAFFTLDQNPDSSVVDMYSNKVRYFDYDHPTISVKGMHIDHAMAKENWGSFENNATTDLHHLFPADGDANVAKRYYALGVVSSPKWTNGVSKVGMNTFPGAGGMCFEPADQYKGDFARAYLYIATAYEDLADLWQTNMMGNNQYPVFYQWAIDLLLQWNQQDPVDARELARNEAIYTMQGNRNPFVDYPNLANYIWGNDTTSVYPFPTETTPYLYAPLNGDEVNYGGVRVDTTYQVQLPVGGMNLTGDLSLALLDGNQGFTISANTFPAQSVVNDTVLTVSFSSANFGEYWDTLVLWQAGLPNTVSIPLYANASNEFLLTTYDKVGPDQATIYWMEYPLATEYLVDVYNGDSIAGDLFISHYSCDTLNNRAIGLYNGTHSVIDLSKYELKIQHNGAGSFVTSMPLRGFVQPDSTYFLVSGTATDPVLLSLADSIVAIAQPSDVMNFDGNDAIALYRSGVYIDIVGVKDEPRFWGKNLSMERDTSITHPELIFKWDEWVLRPYSVSQAMTQHLMDRRSFIGYDYRQISVGNQKTMHVTGIHPNYHMTCKVYAIVGTDTIASDNTMQFRTHYLNIPYALDATTVTSNSFYANWDDTPGAVEYQLSVFTMTPGDTVSEVEHFDSVLSIGRPLPLDWQSNAYGAYLDTASCGAMAPALKLSAQNDYIQSKNYVSPVEKLSFVARFAQPVLEAQIILEAGFNNKFERVDTIYCSDAAKRTYTYQFSPDKQYRTFRWVFAQNYGNAGFSLDDVKATYHANDTTYIMFNRFTSVTNFNVLGVNEGQKYYYYVRGFFCHLASEKSNVIEVTPQAPVAVKDNQLCEINFYTQPEGIMLYNLQPNSLVKVYSLSGVCLWSGRAGNQEQFIPMLNKNIYIIQVIDYKGSHVIKVVK